MTPHPFKFPTHVCICSCWFLQISRRFWSSWDLFHSLHTGSPLLHWRLAKLLLKLTSWPRKGSLLQVSFSLTTAHIRNYITWSWFECYRDLEIHVKCLRRVWARCLRIWGIIFRFWWTPSTKAGYTSTRRASGSGCCTPNPHCIPNKVLW